MRIAATLEKQVRVALSVTLHIAQRGMTEFPLARPGYTDIFFYFLLLQSSRIPPSPSIAQNSISFSKQSLSQSHYTQNTCLIDWHPKDY